MSFSFAEKCHLDRKQSFRKTDTHKAETEHREKNRQVVSQLSSEKESRIQPRPRRGLVSFPTGIELFVFFASGFVVLL